MQNLEKQLNLTKQSSRILNTMQDSQRNAVLLSMAEILESQSEYICQENAKDLQLAKDLPQVMQKRLELNHSKILAMAQGIRDIVKLPCVVGEIMESWQSKAGLNISKISVPLGVVGVIYESRPNVTSDVASLCFKSGNACVLKGGKEAYHSNKAIHSALQQALQQHNLPKECVSMIQDTSRESVLAFVKMDKYVDLLIPRGGEGLIEFVKHNASIPIIKHDKGVCHTYIHKDADLQKAKAIVLNAKLSYPAACNACECVIVDSALGTQVLSEIVESLHTHKISVRFETQALLESLGTELDGLADFTKEWGDRIINLKIVGGFEEALEHISRYGSGHSECIVSENKAVCEKFLSSVDAACVYVNASTRFSDGGEFGFGAEIGISTSKLHARGPMGIESLRSYKYCIVGNGEVRE
ncbi:glutamate-5-semialdehyde dehydrogenase [uncultured Helicobacter sp.]|uniref:glutamate-5-semialdehyde dehydrogenase n=1 Tax=uncultured Helicobacter sp. TaxID=175537 RepID=UPI00260E57FB|nr:glutamate-5-semialdehyde dehydrogenase [uncultured Helicobacter sp.]